MLDVLSFLFSLATAINAIIDKIKLSEQRKLVRSIHSFHQSLQAIVNNAERIFTLIENANEQINELGEAKFTKIIQENFRNQLSRLEMLAFDFHNPEMSTILDKLDTDLKKQAESMLYRKSRRISFTIEQLSFGDLRFIEGELFIDESGKERPAFPEIEKQKEILSKLKNCSQTLGERINPILYHF